MTEKAIITGVTGQDGAYLIEFLVVKGYEVHSIKRRIPLILAGGLRVITVAATV